MEIVLKDFNLFFIKKNYDLDKHFGYYTFGIAIKNGIFFSFSFYSDLLIKTHYIKMNLGQRKIKQSDNIFLLE
jgi:hypothetical protein